MRRCDGICFCVNFLLPISLLLSPLLAISLSLSLALPLLPTFCTLLFDFISFNCVGFLWHFGAALLLCCKYANAIRTIRNPAQPPPLVLGSRRGVALPSQSQSQINLYEKCHVSLLLFFTLFTRRWQWKYLCIWPWGMFKNSADERRVLPPPPPTFFLPPPSTHQPTQSSLPTRTLSQPFCWAPVRNLRVDKSHKVCTASYPDPPPACSCCCCPAPPPLPTHSPCLSSTFICSNSLSALPTSSWDTAVALTRPVFQ